jgi:dTDP-4-amino-4,6-dideoxygalactose transaminase
MSRLKAINDLHRHTLPIQAQLNAAVSRVIQSGWFVLGPEVTAFEKEFAAYCGTAHCVSLANGTDALELALRALDIGPGKTVLTVANAGMYSSVGILATGATPLYADISPDTLLLDVTAVKCLLDQHRVDAIIVTHLYGLLADIEGIVQLAQARDIPVVEDCAQSHGATRQGKKVGSFGDIACFSFYPTKNLGALGDGGAIVTSRQDLADRVRQFRQYGWGSKYSVTLAGGRNSRLDEMQAAILRVKLPLLDQWNNRRRDIATRYSKGIKHPKVTTPEIHGVEYVAHLYVVRSAERDRLKQHLTDAGIPSDVHYPIPDHAQAAYRMLFTDSRLPVTEQACQEVLTLPCFPEMTDAEVDAVIACVNSW